MPREILTPLKVSQRPRAVLVVGYDLSRKDSTYERGTVLWESKSCRIQKYGRGRRDLYRTSTGREVDTANLFGLLANAYTDWRHLLVYTWDLPTLLELSDFRLEISAGHISISQRERLSKLEGSLERLCTTDRYLILNNPPNLVKLVSPRHNQRLQIVDIKNYGIESLEQLYTLVEPRNDSGLTFDDTGRIRAGDKDTMERIIGHFICRYDSLCLECSLGGARYSRGSQAIESYRKGRVTHQVYKTESALVQRIERQAYIGGRAEAFGIGRYDGPCYYLDVTSMYPYIAANRELPCEYIETIVSPSLSVLREICEKHFAIASLQCETEAPIFPARERDKTSYPIGKFNSVLPSPEILPQLNRGCITKVYAVCCYRTQPWLSCHAEAMLKFRQTYRTQGKRLEEFIIKGITNSLYGRLGLLGSTWVPDRSLVPAGPFATWVESDTTKGIPYLCRSINWESERLERGTEVEQTMVAAAAAITSYGRVMLNNLIELAGKENTLYCATDGLIVTKLGYDRLQNAPIAWGTQPGNLRVIAESDHCTIAANGVFELGNKVSAMGVGTEDLTVFLTFSRLDNRYDPVYEKDGELNLSVKSYTRRPAYYNLMAEADKMPWRFVPPKNVNQEALDPSCLWGLIDLENT